MIVVRPADLVGHSDGAVVAMSVAMRRPELVNRPVMNSGGFNKSGEAMPDMDWNVGIVPGASRFLTQGKPPLVNAIVLDSLTNEPVPIVAPIRRVPAGKHALRPEPYV